MWLGARDLEVRPGITWIDSEHLTFALVGKNLLKDHHLEANSLDQTEISSLIQSGVHANFTWQLWSQSK
jgi:hypothetical protein